MSGPRRCTRRSRSWPTARATPRSSSGGYSLLPLLKLRLASPTLLVDIRDLDGLDEIIETDDGLRIGGRATHRRDS